MDPARLAVFQQLEAMLAARPDAAGTNPRPVPATSPFSQCTRDAPPPLWPGRIPLQHVTLLIGVPDSGKSLIALDLAARLSRGAGWPDGTPMPAPAGSLILAGEDLAGTVNDRLIGFGADLARITSLEGVRVGARLDALRLDEHMAVLRQAIKDRPDTKLIVIDPLASFTGKMDLCRMRDARRLMHGLNTVASHTGCAVLAIGHLGKRRQPAALHRTLGSSELTAVARSVQFVTPDPDSRPPARRLMFSAKHNLGPPAPTLGYRITAQDGKPKIEWEPVDPGLTLDEVLRGSRGRPSDGRLEKACAFLTDTLAAGPVPARKVVTLAEAARIALTTLHRAKTLLGVATIRKGAREESRSLWHLAPETDDAPATSTVPLAHGEGTGSLHQ